MPVATISRAMPRFPLTATGTPSPGVRSFQGGLVGFWPIQESRSNPDRIGAAAVNGARLHRKSSRRMLGCSSCAQALALLTSQPLYVAPVPPIHLEFGGVGGTLWVTDRASGEQFQVYTPRFCAQFRGGHRAGLWYLRPKTDAGIVVRSSGFPTARDAIEALRTGTWRLP